MFNNSTVRVATGIKNTVHGNNFTLVPASNNLKCVVAEAVQILNIKDNDKHWSLDELMETITNTSLSNSSESVAHSEDIMQRVVNEHANILGKNIEFLRGVVIPMIDTVVNAVEERMVNAVPRNDINIVNSTTHEFANLGEVGDMFHRYKETNYKDGTRPPSGFPPIPEAELMEVIKTGATGFDDMVSKMLERNPHISISTVYNTTYGIDLAPEAHDVMGNMSDFEIGLIRYLLANGFHNEKLPDGINHELNSLMTGITAHRAKSGYDVLFSIDQYLRDQGSKKLVDYIKVINGIPTLYVNPIVFEEAQQTGITVEVLTGAYYNKEVSYYIDTLSSKAHVLVEKYEQHFAETDRKARLQVRMTVCDEIVNVVNSFLEENNNSFTVGDSTLTIQLPHSELHEAMHIYLNEHVPGTVVDVFSIVRQTVGNVLFKGTMIPEMLRILDELDRTSQNTELNPNVSHLGLRMVIKVMVASLIKQIEFVKRSAL